MTKADELLKNKSGGFVSNILAARPKLAAADKAVF
jgi:hypothetical protein